MPTSRNHSIATVLAGIIVLTVIGPAAAVPILDQEHFVPFPNASGALSDGSSFGRSQTFTVGVAGILDSIEVQVGGGAPTSARILATAGGAPIGGSGGSTVLAISSSVSNVGDVFTFDFLSAGLGISVGEILAIELFGNGSWQGAFVPGGGSYAGGSDYFFNTDFSINNWTINGDFDWNFRTFVETVPEPTTLALIGLALAGLGLGRRRPA